jgi:hypothetical protein
MDELDEAFGVNFQHACSVLRRAGGRGRMAHDVKEQELQIMAEFAFVGQRSGIGLPPR